MSEKPADKHPERDIYVVIQLPRGEDIHTRVSICASVGVHEEIADTIPALCHRVWRTWVKGISGPLATYFHDPRFDLDTTVVALGKLASNVTVKHLVYRMPDECWLDTYQ